MLTPLEHLAAAEQWATWAKGCYESGVAAELPAAQTCAAIGQLHVSLAVASAQLVGLGPASEGGEPG